MKLYKSLKILKTFFVFAIILFFVNKPLAHKKEMHQYLTREAFKLLEKSFPGQLGFTDYVGTTEVYQTDWSKSWGSGFLVTGAWLEDVTDVVYHYGIGSQPTYNQTLPMNEILAAFGSTQEAYTSITHYWDADGGTTSNVFLNDKVNGIYWSFSINANAFNKIKQYENGTYSFRDFYFPKKMYLSCQNNQPGNIAFAADWNIYPVTTMYKNEPGQMSFNIKYYQSIYDGNWYRFTCTTAGQLCNPMRLGIEILGRMCHLLEDMSVPEHVQNISHANKSGMRSSLYEENEMSFKQWTADEIFASGKKYFNPFFVTPNNTDPIYNLMYVLNQITDHYAGSGVDGDNDFDKSYLKITTTLNALGLSQKASEINYERCRSMHDILQPLTIQLTAGLLYWFAVKTGQLPLLPSQDNMPPLSPIISLILD